MTVDPLGILHTGLFLAVVYGVYGVLVAFVWAPFLFAGRLRALFDALPPRGWETNYALWIPLPAVVWGFVCGCVVSLSLDVRPPTEAASLYVSGVDGIVAATAVSLLLWPLAALYGLPARGVEWYAGESPPTTAALVVAGTVWYLVWLVVPTYFLVVMAGFGQAMGH